MSGYRDTRFQAGPYRWEIYDPVVAGYVDIGIVEDAPEVEVSKTEIEIVGDNMGSGTVQDTLNAGGNAFLSLVVQEFQTAAWRIMVPFHGATDAPVDLQQALGQGDYHSIGAFHRSTGIVRNNVTEYDNGCYILRGTALYPSFSSMLPYQIMARKATLAPNQSRTFMMGTRLKNLPVRFMFYPHPKGNNPSNLPYAYETSNDPQNPLV